MEAGSNWDIDHLFAARVVIRKAQPSDSGHLLPLLRENFGKEVTASKQPRIERLVKGPSQLGQHRTMSETELVQRHGTSLGSFWAALAQFDDVEEAEGPGLFTGFDGVDERDDNGEDHGHEGELEDDFEEDYGQSHEAALGENHREGEDMDWWFGESSKRPYSASFDESASALLLPLPVPNKRSRTTIHRKGFVDPTKIQIDDSSPEQATLKNASIFIRHVFRASPPQDKMENHKPPYLIQFSGVSRELSGLTASGERIRATADGELVLYQLDGSNRYRRTSHRPALLEAKKKFAGIENGRPLLTNELLGQMICEALALRLQQSKDTDNQARENIFVIAAVRRYMRFLQFKIPQSYIHALTTQKASGMLTDFIDVWATEWFDLEGPGGRRGAVDNILALLASHQTDVKQG